MCQSQAYNCTLKQPTNQPNKQHQQKTTTLFRHINKILTILYSTYVRQCWNCNGLSVRVRNETNLNSIRSFLRTKQPDIFFLSEVRLPAAHNAGSRKPCPSSTTFYRGRIRHSDNNSTTDFVAVQKLLTCEDCLHYKAYFSLANTKYAGTAMLVNTKTTQLPTSVRYNLQKLDVKKTVHDTDGRVIFAKFPAFSILHT